MDSEDPAWRNQLHQLAVAIERWTGNHASISEVGEEELLGLTSERRPIVDELEQDAVTLAGPEPRRLLRVKR